MIRRPIIVLAAVAAVVLPFSVLAQQGAAPSNEIPRAIRRDVPMTNAIRRAFAAGTRDTTGRPGPNYWQLQTDYTINVRVDPATQTLTGTETIALANNSPDGLREIYLRLDHNIFRTRVPFAASWIPGEITDGMVITKLVVNDDVLDASTIPSTGRASAGAGKATARDLDRTLGLIMLPTPIAPRSKATLQIDWRLKLPAGPGNGHRMVQRLGDYLFQPTQWFPRIAKFDDLRGWDVNQYLGPSEFYNNFGRFDVSIDVPAGWLVSGTGVLQNPQQVYTATARERLSHVLESDALTTIVGEDEAGPGKATVAGNRLVWRFVADQVNDFAWATSNKYILEATRATIPGKGPIPIYIVRTPERARAYSNIGPAVRHALEFYSKLWVPYPFPQLTVQDGPSDGMEYPMVINSSLGAADHETGHQWWPMMVGNNETWYGWMDEGFNQYMNILSDADFAKQTPRLNGEGQSYGRTSGNENEPPMMWNANFGGPSYGFTTYGKTPLMLSMLGGVVGDDNVQKAMSNYAKVWAFKHPSPWDYIFFMNAELKQDLNWFWYYWLWTTESVDGKIEDVTTSGTRTTVVVRQDGQMPSPVVLRVTLADQGGPITPMPNARIDGNSALVTFPVDVWFNGSRTYRAELDFGRAITRIQLDPACRFPDRDATDNVWPRPAPPPHQRRRLLRRRAPHRAHAPAHARDRQRTGRAFQLTAVFGVLCLGAGHVEHPGRSPMSKRYASWSAVGALVVLAGMAAPVTTQTDDGLARLTVPARRLPAGCRLEPVGKDEYGKPRFVMYPGRLDANPWTGTRHPTVAIIRQALEGPSDQTRAQIFAGESPKETLGAYVARYAAADGGKVEVYAVRFDDPKLTMRAAMLPLEGRPPRIILGATVATVGWSHPSRIVVPRPVVEACYQTVRGYIAALK